MDLYTFAAPVLAAQGNHDYSGRLSTSQLIFRNDSRWRSEFLNYTISVPQVDLSIVVFDSPRGCPSYMSAPYGDCTELCMLQLAEHGCTNATDRPGAPRCFLDHVRWLNETLAALTTKWKFVAAHHPIDQENVKFVIPALAAHGVQAMFAGHVHNMQHSVGADSVHYFISGAGAFASALAEGGDGAARVAAIRPGAHSHASRLVACPEGSACAPLRNGFFADGPGFLSVALDSASDQAVATFTHQNGTALYTVAINA